MSANARDTRQRRGTRVATRRCRGRLLAAIGFALAVAAPAGAVVQVDCDTPDDFCTGNPCVTTDPLDVTVASCVLDFMGRDLVIKNKIDMEVSGSVLSLTAGSIEVQRTIDGKQNGGDGTDISLIATTGDVVITGKLEASGDVSSGNIVLDASANVDLSKKVRSKGKGVASGGTLTIDAGGTVTSSKKGRIDVRGVKNTTAGGQVTITGPLGVDLTGRIDARGKPGGSVNLSSPSGSITVREQLRMEGWRKAAGGGSATLNAGGDITVTAGKGKILAEGRGPGGGTISLTATGTVDANKLSAEAFGVPGGTVAVLAGTVSARDIFANGDPGGTIELTSTVGDVTVRAAKARGGSIGGLIEVDSAANATIQKRALVRGRLAGGEARVAAIGNIVLGSGNSGRFDARGIAGGVVEGAAGGNLTAGGKFQAQTGGCIGLSAGGTLDTMSASFDLPTTGSCP